MRCAAVPPRARPGSPGPPPARARRRCATPGSGYMQTPQRCCMPQQRCGVWVPGLATGRAQTARGVTRGPRPQGARAPPPPPRPRERPAARPEQDDLTRKATDELLAELRGAAGARIPFQREGPGSRPRARLVLNELARRHRLGPHPLPVRVRPAAGARVAAAWERPRGPGHLLSLRDAPGCPLRVSAQGALRPSLWSQGALDVRRGPWRQGPLEVSSVRPGLPQDQAWSD